MEHLPLRFQPRKFRALALEPPGGYGQEIVCQAGCQAEPLGGCHPGEDGDLMWVDLVGRASNGLERFVRQDGTAFDVIATVFQLPAVTQNVPVPGQDRFDRLHVTAEGQGASPAKAAATEPRFSELDQTGLCLIVFAPDQSQQCQAPGCDGVPLSNFVERPTDEAVG